MLRLLRNHRHKISYGHLLDIYNVFRAGPNKHDSFVVLLACAEIDRQRQMNLSYFHDRLSQTIRSKIDRTANSRVVYLGWLLSDVLGKGIYSIYFFSFTPMIASSETQRHSTQPKLVSRLTISLPGTISSVCLFHILGLH